MLMELLNSMIGRIFHVGLELSWEHEMQETGFFRGWEGSWDTPYGRFFLSWYSRSLMDHGERLLRAASSVFNFRLSPGRQNFLAQKRQQNPEVTLHSISLQATKTMDVLTKGASISPNRNNRVCFIRTEDDSQ